MVIRSECVMKILHCKKKDLFFFKWSFKVFVLYTHVISLSLWFWAEIRPRHALGWICALYHYHLRLCVTVILLDSVSFKTILSRHYHMHIMCVNKSFSPLFRSQLIFRRENIFSLTGVSVGGQGKWAMTKCVSSWEARDWLVLWRWRWGGSSY